MSSVKILAKLFVNFPMSMLLKNEMQIELNNYKQYLKTIDNIFFQQEKRHQLLQP